MLATAHVVYDRAYYQTLYADWLQHRSVWRRYAVLFSFAMICWGVSMSVRFRSQWLVGMVFASFGFYEFIAAVTHRRRWISERLFLARNDKAVDLAFDQTTLTSTTINGSSRIQFAGFLAFVPASNGFFLIPDTGVSLYVPKAAIEPSTAYDTLIELLAVTVNTVSTASASGEQEQSPVRDSVPN